MDLNVKSKKPWRDKVVLFEQKRPGLVMFLRGRNRAEKRRGRASSLALHEYYSNERWLVPVVLAAAEDLSPNLTPPLVEGIFLPSAAPLEGGRQNALAKLPSNYRVAGATGSRISRVTRSKFHDGGKIGQE